MIDNVIISLVYNKSSKITVGKKKKKTWQIFKSKGLGNKPQQAINLRHTCYYKHEEVMNRT